MAIVFGTRGYGKVDRVPGVCYVLTHFAHLNYVPLVPTACYLVIEGSESGDAFHGKPLRMSGKSVLVGYLRFWVGAVALVSGLLGFIRLHADLAAGGKVPQWASIALFLSPCVLIPVALFVRGWASVAAQVAVHLLTVAAVVACETGFPPGRGPDGLYATLAVANGFLVAYRLLRLFDHASPARTEELLRLLHAGSSANSANNPFENDPDQGAPPAPAPPPWRRGNIDQRHQ